MQELEPPGWHPAKQFRGRLSKSSTTGNDHRLARNLEHLVEADPTVKSLGPDLDVMASLQERGVHEGDVATATICVSNASFVLLCVRQVRWHDPNLMAQLQGLRSEAREFSKRIVLLPESFVQRQPRLQELRPVVRTTNYQLPAKLRIKVLLNLLERGAASLLSCVSMVEEGHPDPVGCIFQLVRAGAIWMDLDKHLDLEGLVYLPDHEFDASALIY